MASLQSDGLHVLLKCKDVSHHLLDAVHIGRTNILRFAQKQALHEMTETLEDEP